jgi:hypothetical protein
MVAVTMMIRAPETLVWTRLVMREEGGDLLLIALKVEEAVLLSLQCVRILPKKDVKKSSSLQRHSQE